MSLPARLAVIILGSLLIAPVPCEKPHAVKGEIVFSIPNSEIDIPSRRAPRAPARVETTPAERAFLEAMNEERAGHGLRPLHLDAILMAAAHDRIRDMFAKHYFDHTSPDGIRSFSWAAQRGYDFRAMAENLAIGYDGAHAVVDGWMHSPGHRANLLNGDFDDLGVAIADGSPTPRFGGPVVVALYGRRMNE